MALSDLTTSLSCCSGRVEVAPLSYPVLDLLGVAAPLGITSAQSITATALYVHMLQCCLLVSCSQMQKDTSN